MNISGVSIIASCQTFLIVCAIFLSSAALKVNLYEGVGIPLPGLELSKTIRSHGYLLLLVPLVWALIAIYFRSGRFAGTRLSTIVHVAGVGLCLVFFSLIVAGFVMPFVPPLQPVTMEEQQ